MERSFSSSDFWVGKKQWPGGAHPRKSPPCCTSFDPAHVTDSESSWLPKQLVFAPVWAWGGTLLNSLKTLLENP